MKKSTVIARCLMNNKAVRTLEEGENIVERLFATEFSILDYADWNQEISETRANAVTCTIEDAARLNIRQLIRDLM
ncbi:MAG: hypothetical protein ACK4TA_25595 [Saprospiraceae bacterium]